MANHLDPLDVELLKSSLGESSCLDSDDFKHHFHQVVDELNDDELGFDMLNNFLSAHKVMKVTSEEQSGMEFASSSFTEHLVELKKDINLMPQNMQSSSPIASSVGALNFSNTEEHSSTIEASLPSDISSSIPSTN
ncbi:hypothetical protein LOK49_LG10G00266 [Camellia lanceoleosa]|uniref:Uncharacterized protein n=1 Tax=Camellia lanceoleosa TaxID=1840588 RepID=A0ACC0G661_9ERIC|nr:hypothetical protein LOK49_LG10G00266 [Camellia lanceoleosa]